jgi:hypothetical protein
MNRSIPYKPVGIGDGYSRNPYSLPRAGGSMGVFPQQNNSYQNPEEEELSQTQTRGSLMASQFENELVPRWSDSFMGNPTQARQRSYTLGREAEELGRLKMAEEGSRLQSQMAFQPQMDALRGGIMGRMAGRLGVQLPQMGQSYQSGTGYTPSWMQSYQPPQFPRY